jgi:hypothetical protein
MSAEIVVFLGPSLPRDEAAATLPATYLPPAQQGSVMRAWLDHRPRAMVLIDGVFGSVPAVRHKEILWMCAKGLPVFGAASIGAIRAAELAMVGMRGFGFIHRWYALTPLADDDEVAVAISPAELGAEPLSEALISMRLTLRRAHRENVLSLEQRRALEELARSTHFVDRCYAQLAGQARLAFPHLRDAVARFESWLPGRAVNQKREDALGLLSRLARQPNLLAPLPLRPSFHMTESWAHDLAADGVWDGKTGGPRS